MKQQPVIAATCPCGNANYQTCCAPLHAGIAASSAEALMRSRYSAYVMQLASYLLTSWHSSTRPASMAFDSKTRWLGLSVLAHSEHADSAQVEFVARFAEGGGRAFRLHEVSRFLREDGCWRYLDSNIN